MDHNDNTKGGHFDASMPLPKDDDQLAADTTNLAADVARRKLEALYGSEPEAAAEASDMVLAGDDNQFSPHQKFLLDLTSSGKSLAEIQDAWHEYYAGLPDDQKHQVWQEFYSAHAQASRYATAAPTIAKPKPRRRAVQAVQRRVRKPAPKAKRVRKQTDTRLKPIHHLQSVIFGLGMGALVVLIFLFSFFNERFIAPFIQPSRSVTNTPIISENTISNPNPEIIIPKLNVEIPVVYGVTSIDTDAVEHGLEGGALHYADTALPGQDGNTVIIGHSAVNIFGPGRYKFAFSLLRKLDGGDTFYLQKDSKRYTYQIYKKEVVNPSDVQVLGPADRRATVTLITCDPPGLNVNRLVVIGEQIDPSPAQNTPALADQNTLATKAAIVPGNPQSLWSRITHWFTH